jgi:hypothetical protein
MFFSTFTATYLKIETLEAVTLIAFLQLNVYPNGGNPRIYPSLAGSEKNCPCSAISSVIFVLLGPQDQQCTSPCMQLFLGEHDYT